MRTAVYNKKIGAYIKFYKFCYRFRTFLTISATILAGTSATLMGIKGIITEDISSNDVYYGDPINFTNGKSFYGDDTTIEYRDVNQEVRSEEKPTLVGNYEARAVAKNIFGGNSYGTAHPFAIKQKQVKPVVEDTNIVYGSSPTISFNDLADGDRLANANFELINITTTPQITFKEGDFLIVDEEGVDVTANYSIDYSPIDFKVLPRDVTYVAASEKVYDGTPLYASADCYLSSGTLVEGDHIEVLSSDSITNPGSIKTNAKVRIVSEKYGDQWFGRSDATGIGNH